jgi:hypothetical protein
MSKFVKYLSRCSINGMNLALYSGGAVRLENVVNGKSVAAKHFTSADAAQDWYDELPGDVDSEKLTAAMSAMLDRTGKDGDGALTAGLPGYPDYSWSLGIFK